MNIAEFKKHMNKLRRTKKYYSFAGHVNNKAVLIKGYGTWLEIFYVNMVDHSGQPDIKVSEFNFKLEQAIKYEQPVTKVH